MKTVWWLASCSITTCQNPPRACCQPESCLAAPYRIAYQYLQVPVSLQARMWPRYGVKPGRPRSLLYDYRLGDRLTHYAAGRDLCHHCPVGHAFGCKIYAGHTLPNGTIQDEWSKPYPMISTWCVLMDLGMWRDAIGATCDTSQPNLATPPHGVPLAWTAPDTSLTSRISDTMVPQTLDGIAPSTQGSLGPRPCCCRDRFPTTMPVPRSTHTRGGTMPLTYTSAGYPRMQHSSGATECHRAGCAEHNPSDSNPACVYPSASHGPTGGACTWMTHTRPPGWFEWQCQGMSDASAYRLTWHGTLYLMMSFLWLWCL